MANINCVRIFKLNPKGIKNAEGKLEYFKKKAEFRRDMHSTRIASVIYLEKAGTIVTASTGCDTSIRAWSLTGELLKEHNTN